MSNNKQFFVRVDGQRIAVTEEVYLEYYRSERRMRYYERDIKTGVTLRDESGNIAGFKPAKEDSLNRLMDAGTDYADDCESVEDAAVRAVMSDKLCEALGTLPDSDRELIVALFYSNDGDGMSEREYSETSGVPRKTVAYRRERVLRKLKKLLEN